MEAVGVMSGRVGLSRMNTGRGCQSGNTLHDMRDLSKDGIGLFDGDSVSGECFTCLLFYW